MVVDLSALVPEKHWECPNCDLQEVTRETNPHSRFHTCPGLRGMTAPMVPAGTKCKVELGLREDYVGNEDVKSAIDRDGNVYMNVRTTREDGEDLAVYAPTAHGKLRM